MANSPDPRSTLLERIRDNIRRSDEQSSGLKRKNSRYITTGVITSALGTVLAATAAAVGPVIGAGPSAWKLTCAAVALCSGIATVVMGLQKQHSLTERLAKATSCSGKLRSLEFALTVTQRETSEVAREYETVISSYSEVLS